MKVLAEIDEKEYGLLCRPSEVKPLLEALARVYGLIWCEACYDPYNESTEKFARSMLADMKLVNSILKFK